MKRNIFCALGVALIAVACNSVKEDTAPVQYGEISVSLGDPELEVITKAFTALDPESDEASQYVVRVFSYDTNEQQGIDATYKDFQPMKLPLGKYYVSAENCTPIEAEEGDGKMRIAGDSKDAPITLTSDNLSQTATVNCSVANARVAVVYDESVSGLFDNLQVVITGEDGSRVKTVAEMATGVEKEFWFNPQTISYVISGTFKQLNKVISIEGTRTLAAKNNIKLWVKVNLSNGQLLPQIQIDKELDSPTDVPGLFNPYN